MLFVIKLYAVYVKIADSFSNMQPLLVFLSVYNANYRPSLQQRISNYFCFYFYRLSIGSDGIV